MEVLIAASVFGMLSVIAATFFLNISQSQRTTDSYSALYEDARVIMENLATEIRNGTVDYEEYFNITSADSWNGGGIVDGSRYYGINRGVYASRFYDPGYRMVQGEIQKGLNPADLGIQCLGANGLESDCPEVSIFSLSVDRDMGKHPYDWDGTNEKDASAMDTNDQPELYLISKEGRNKTVIIKQQIMGTTDSVLSVLRLTGEDLDNNGVVDGFFCAQETTGCVKIPTTTGFPFTNEDKKIAPHQENSIFDINSPFTPISPFRSNVKDIHFIITPTEDPYKAFDEPKVQIHPSVTIVMTLEPSSAEKAKLPTEQQNQSITVQTTVSTGLTSRLKTYPPTSDLKWINSGSVL